MKHIACIQSDFPEKFGIPRQSGLIASLSGRIVFEPKYRHPDAVKGLEQFSHLWLLWEFSENIRDEWSATVRPPRLGGKTHVGVFATRSPFRPNPIGLSCVKLDKIAYEDVGPVLYVSGIDMMNNTPIYDIKPYIPITDCHPEALEGFTKETKHHKLNVQITTELLSEIDNHKKQSLLDVLAQDPRPAYDHDESRIYGLSFAGYEIKFQVKRDVLTVISVENTRIMGERGIE